jgi:hypothetical protein
MENLELFLIFSGYIFGLGAVTVIDILGFLGTKSSYWNEATIRTHKVTKPLIWLGTFLAVAGYFLYFKDNYDSNTFKSLVLIFSILILNGIFLSFYISPILLKREKEGLSKEILSKSLQLKIFISFIISDLGWWGSLILFLWSI